MKLITQVEELSSSRSRVYLDYEFAFVLYKGELRRYHIKKNAMLSEEDYEIIMTQILPKRAKLRAMHLLKAREYTQKQLEDKLKQQYYPAGIIQTAVDYVKSYRYIDDERYARDYITGQLEKRSRRRIEEDLAGRGISRELVHSILEEIEPDKLQQAETERIEELLRKKRYDPEEMSYEEKQKIMAYICRKGYAPETVRRVMKETESF